MNWIGRNVPRLEDPVLVRGEGRFLAAAHDGQAGRLGADLAAGDRRIDIVAAEIADALGIGYKTVANGCSLLKAKLGVARTSELVRLAMTLGIA